MTQWSAPYELRKMVATYNRLGGGTQDIAVTTHHFLNLTADAPDASWLAADYTQVEDAFTVFWNAIKGLYTVDMVLGELRWYADGPAFKPRGTTVSPMLRATTKNLAGTVAESTGMCPPQTAITVTEVTAARYSTVAREGRPSQLRHRWGRFYLPAPAITVLGAGPGVAGRLTAAAQTTIANAAQTFYNACRAGNQLVPVMYSPTNGNSYTVDELHVDDILDVVRSRRYENPLSRAVRTLTAI